MKSTVRRIAKRVAITGGLQAARLLQVAGLMRSARGRGAIFTLHHVRPKRTRAFDPNAHLEITPEFLDAALERLSRSGYRFIALDALPAHLASADETPVAVFTLDDGYRNNLEHAAPVFSRHKAPFTVFVTGGFIDRTQSLWWETLADLIGARTHLSFDFGHGSETLAVETQVQKQKAFERFAAHIHGSDGALGDEKSGDEASSVAAIDAMIRSLGGDPLATTAELTLDEAGLRTLIENPLASLGAHTITHRALARLSDDAAQQELSASISRIEAITGKRPVTLAYPYGDRAAVSARDTRLAREQGLIAVTTQPGTLETSSDITALPRISLNGHFQKPGYLSALASGIPFKLLGRAG